MVNDDFMIHSCIQNLDTNEVVFDMSDVIVNYFDDQYIYTSSTNDSDIHYRIYDWNGNLVKEIVPSHEFLDDTYETNNMFWKTNGSQIIRIVDGNIVAVTTKNKVDHLYMCQISDGSCKFVN